MKVVVAGCRVQEGTMHRSSTVRVYRNDESIFEGGVADLKVCVDLQCELLCPSSGSFCSFALTTTIAEPPTKKILLV